MPQNTDVYALVKASVIGTIQSLRLDGCKDILDQVNDETSNVVYPHVVCTELDVTDRVGVGDSQLRDGQCPITVIIRDNAGKKAVHLLSPQYKKWRRLIFDAFQQRRFFLPTQETFTTLVDPRPVLDTRRPEYQGVASSFVIWCEFWDDRN